ncbi:MAG: Pnap_2097 family protein [Myxococcota bacterium]
MTSNPADIQTITRPLETSVLVGMPQLGLNGLSENWMLKEVGHRHWAAICAEAGIQSHQITDSKGQRLYAAFVGIDWSGDPLSGIGENDVLHFRTEITRFSSKRFYSRNELRSTSGTQLVVKMVSIFVRKPVFDDNRSLSGGHPDPLRRIEQRSTPLDATRIQEAWKTTKETHPAPATDGLVHQQNICPTTDFNGARLLYFANFQHILDQAEWAVLPKLDMQFASSEGRRLYFYGNVNFEDVLEVRFQDVRWESDARMHRADIVRAKDGSRLATVETRKRIVNPR